MRILSDNCTIQGLNIQRFSSDGIFIDGSQNKISGNFIGTDVTGTLSRGNGKNGIDLSSGENCTIGTPGSAGGNIVSGNGTNGMVINGKYNILQGNLIGTDASSSVKPECSSTAWL